MADFRRFYSPGLEHCMHLEELERSASSSKKSLIRTRRTIIVLRQWLARILTTLARRIDPVGGSHSGKAKPALS